MSTILVLLIKDSQAELIQIHYRDVLSFLDADEPFLNFKDTSSNTRFIDAGYLVIDLDKRTILDAQSAFNPRSKAFKIQKIID